ncbi:MAG TPA: ABC transporter permease [Acidimicrobiales bacterium]|nr:ABC transporter permease [Acidimicrobiales bacterium]
MTPIEDAAAPAGAVQRLRAIGEEARRTAGSRAWPARTIRWIATVVAFYYAVELIFGSNSVSLANLIQGLALGSLYGIIGVGIILIYRTSRIINFAAGAIGAVPAIFALLLDLQFHVNYLLVLPIALIGGPALGALVDITVMRRFARSPRLITTVVTIGVAQSLAVLGFFIPIWLGQKANNLQSLVPTPWSRFAIHNHRGQPTLTGNHIAAFVVVVALTAGLGAFLRYTRVGIALRASAENADRALLLGIPVKRVATAAWALAGLLSALAIFVQAPLTGTPSDASLGFDTLLYGLAAAVVARMERFGVALAAGLGIGVVITASIIGFGDDSVSSAFMLLIILGALLLQRRQMARAASAGDGTWQTVKQFRPIPTELRSLPEVVRARWGLGLGAVGFMVALPFIAGGHNIAYITLLPLYGMVGVSLVVLTGWAGQISLGQFGLVGVAAGVAGGLIANHNIDFFTALGLGIATGVVAAIVIGLPAVRIQGLYLAVATLAFSYAVPGFVLNNAYFVGRLILPSGLSAHLYRPVLYGIIDLTSFTDSGQRNFYYVCLIFLGLCMACAYAFRRNRSGRVLIAARDNERAAPAYSINLARTRLAAFAVSGGIAGVAGVLFAYDQGNVVAGSYGPQASIMVFLAAATAGISSVGWTVFGVMFLEASVAFGPRIYDLLGSTWESVLPLLLTGPLLLASLYFYPGGSAQNGFDMRDRWLRRIAERRSILVPSLVADRRVEESAEAAVVLEAERHVAAVPAVAEPQGSGQ